MKDIKDIIFEGLIGSRSRNVASLGEAVADMFRRLLAEDLETRDQAFLEILDLLKKDSIPLVKKYSYSTWTPAQIQSEDPLIIVMSYISGARRLHMSSVQMIHPRSRRGIVIGMYNVSDHVTGYERYEDMQPVRFRDGRMHLVDSIPIWIVRKESPVRKTLDEFMDRAYKSSTKWRWA